MTPPLLLLLLACFFRAGASGAAAPPDCAALGDGAYPDESDCAGYYECAGGVATEQQCPWGLFFNSGQDRIFFAVVVVPVRAASNGV